MIMFEMANLPCNEKNQIKFSRLKYSSAGNYFNDSAQLI
ncbi:hypothetical protein AC15_3934 [Escherichia coli 2-156-04_S3_C2]|nr:hypothetical protein ECSTEC7V_4141 [Escherichia coli STEC_7v]KDA56301.1 hypothetical protein AA98_4039 [Escherichia coli 2-011-08_S1_C1]KDW28740.1 hypothetical protein AC15_3934 [Escherichia coli 2-156-04_S3_C2]